MQKFLIGADKCAVVTGLGACGCKPLSRTPDGTLHRIARLHLPPQRQINAISQGRIWSFKCKSIKGPMSSDEGKPYNMFESLHFPVLTSLNNLLKCLEKHLHSRLELLRLVKETISSFIFVFLFGILLYMDSVKFFKSQAVLKLQLVEMIASSYIFPFLVSAVITALVGHVCIPYLKLLKAYQVFRIEGPSQHLSKVGTPTMGGLYFVPVGVFVAMIITLASSAHVAGLAAVTFVFGAIGLLDDTLTLVRKHNYGLPGLYKLFLQAVAGICFYYWHEFAGLPIANRV
ncbi:hypothetical protein KP509_13G004700 [Ceratopteris richardii]|nr:hypothetical protein KP509_13G004700 [Ceratopteris richardii]